MFQPFLQEHLVYSLRIEDSQQNLIAKIGDLNERGFIIRLFYKDSY